MGRVLSGRKFNAQYRNKIFIKIINKDYKHFDHEYIHGINEDKIPFNPDDSCLPGGLYFITENYLIEFLYIIQNRNGKYIVRVSIPDDAQVYKDPEGNKFKTDKMFVDLNNKKTLDEYYPELEKNIFENIHLVNDYNIRYITELLFMYKKPLQITNARLLKNETFKRICLIAVSRDGKSLALIPHKFRTADICMNAVINRGSAIEYVPIELINPEICRCAVLNDDYMALKYIPKEFITGDLCLNAVMRNGLAVQFVPTKFITDEIRDLAAST